MKELNKGDLILLGVLLLLNKFSLEYFYYYLELNFLLLLLLLLFSFQLFASMLDLNSKYKMKKETLYRGDLMIGNDSTLIKKGEKKIFF